MTTFCANGFNFDKIASNLFLYTGIFLQEPVRDRILELCPPRHKNIYVDHITLCFKPSEEEVLQLAHWVDDHGEEVEFYTTHLISDKHGQAIAVNILGDMLPIKSKHPHITISCEEGTTPVYSKKLMDRLMFPSDIEADIWTPRRVYKFKGTLGTCAITDRRLVPEKVWKRRGLATL